MTKEDALFFLGRFRTKRINEKLYDALGVAIEALAQPEIVRCKDCKYMTGHYDTDGNAPYWTCSEWDSGTDYDGFCHYAERR